MGDSRDRSFSDVDEEIMHATHCALREHGYADLTIKQIAEEYGKSTAAVHYHYETKDELLATFLDYILDQVVEAIRDVDTTDPERRLNLLLDKLLVAPEDHHDLLIATLELRSQAPYEEAFDDRFRQTDEFIRSTLEAVIDDGIEEGVFADVDAEHVARALATIVDGAHVRAVVPNEPGALTTARQAADEYVQAVLLEE